MKPVLHLLHVGKTGGTALRSALAPRAEAGRFSLRLHGHEVTLEQIPAGEAVVFFLRDPITRFTSGFYSRQRQGRPRYHRPWSPEEQVAFERFPTPNRLALALDAKDAEERAAAVAAMRGIRHVRDFYTKWFGGEARLRERWADVFFIGFQEALAEDFQVLRAKLGLGADTVLPEGDFDAHRSPAHLDRGLEPRALANLSEWYREDVEFYGVCRELAKERRT